MLATLGMAARPPFSHAEIFDMHKQLPPPRLAHSRRYSFDEFLPFWIDRVGVRPRRGPRGRRR